MSGSRVCGPAAQSASHSCGVGRGSRKGHFAVPGSARLELRGHLWRDARGHGAGVHQRFDRQRPEVRPAGVAQCNIGGVQAHASSKYLSLGSGVQRPESSAQGPEVGAQRAGFWLLTSSRTGSFGAFRVGLMPFPIALTPLLGRGDGYLPEIWVGTNNRDMLTALIFFLAWQDFDRPTVRRRAQIVFRGVDRGTGRGWSGEAWPKLYLFFTGFHRTVRPTAGAQGW